MKRYAMAIFSLVLGMMGMFSPLSVGPAGGMLAFTAVLGLVTLWRGKDEGADRVRKRAFWSSLAVSGILAGFHLGLNSPPTPLSATWATWISGLSLAAVTLVLILSIHFLLFARKNKPAERRPWIWRAVRIFLLLVPPVVWLGMIAMNYLLIMAVIYQMTLSALSLPVSTMMSKLPADVDLARDITLNPDGTATMTPDPLGMTYSWSCPAPTEFTAGGVSYPLNETDKTILTAFCEKA